MMPVSEVLKTTFDSARSRLGGLEKTVHKLEKKAQASLHELQVKVDGAPKRLEGAWSDLAARIRPGRVFATRDELRELVVKVDELATKVEKLAQARGSRTRTVA
jgi:polyhydroxyalkanoate synthesis regulator phasin